MKVLSAVLWLSSCLCAAQASSEKNSESSQLPESPSAILRLAHSSSSSAETSQVAFANPPQPGTGKYRLNMPYWTVMGVMVAGTIADVETTVSKLHECKGAQEFNSFLYGKRPGRGRMYGINVPIVVTVGWLSAKWKRDRTAVDGHFVWAILPSVIGGVHGIAAFHNASIRC
jgi:hypothetical protein